jgi:ubiquinone/menaquinone biosynthesis C-methylase UbiE
MNKKILDIFKSLEMKGFWGNYFDSRFYIGYLVSKHKSTNILDVGCGVGVLLHLSKAKLKVGLDTSLESVKIGKKLDPSMQLIVGDATKLPFKENIFELVLAVQLLPDLKNLGLDWKKCLEELKLVSKYEIIFAGNNRLSKHHNYRTWEDRISYLNHNEQYELLKNDFEIINFGYDPHSKIIMYPFKKIIFKIPDKISEFLMIDKIIFFLLRSKRYLKTGRSYVLICKKRNIRK